MTDIDACLNLDNQLCFALYVCSKEIIRRYKPLLDPVGLTYTGYITMMALWEKDGISIKELGARLYLDSGTLTPLLKKMEAGGILRRRRSQEDERTVFVELTEKGRALKQKCGEFHHKMSCMCGMDLNCARSMLSSLHGMIADMAKENKD